MILHSGLSALQLSIGFGKVGATSHSWLLMSVKRRSARAPVLAAAPLCFVPAQEQESKKQAGANRAVNEDQ